VPKWQSTDGLDAHHFVEVFVDDTGEELAAVEYFGHGCYYPRALNKVTGNWERGGPRHDLRNALEWAERVATDRMQEGDQMPSFYC
jgi:hypothetical protein